MGPSNDFRQGRLPFGIGRACEQLRPEYRAKVDRWAEQRKSEEQRASCIDYWCDQFREGGSEIRLERPESDPRLHLFVNGKCRGVFVEVRGRTEFCQVEG